MEGEVRPYCAYFCFFFKSRKFVTALILYCIVASLVTMLILDSSGTINKTLRGGSRLISVQLLNISFRGFHNSSIPSLQFAYTNNSRARHVVSRKGMNNTRSTTGKCGSDRRKKDKCDGERGAESKSSERDHNLLHSVARHYRSITNSKPLDFHCNTCALVSSSGQLLYKRAGHQIDSHSCVLRMNVAPTQGFETDVGFKTTVRVVCFISTLALKVHASKLLRGSQKAEKYLFWGLTLPQRQEALSRVQILAKGYGAEFYSLDDEGEAAAGALFKKETGKSRFDTNSWLSTGWFTMMLAIDICNEVHVYGMVPQDYCKEYGYKHVKYHYWQNTWGPSECDTYRANEYTNKGGHRFLTEKAIFRRWAMKYNITFHSPSWDLDKVKYEGDTPINTPINTPFMRREN